MILKNQMEAARKKFGPELKVHEILGIFFVNAIREMLIPRSALEGLLCVAQLILKDDKDFPIARGFIIGTIDADRIDFVRRDGFFSGLFDSSVDFGRLFEFYEVAEDKKIGKFRPRPSSRAISEKEKLLFERFQDYKYIVVHHRVHLYDELMENVAIRLMAIGKLSYFTKTLTALLEMNQIVELLEQFTDVPLLHKTEEVLTKKLEKVQSLKGLLTNFDDPSFEVEIRNVYQGLKDLDKDTRKFVEAYVEERRAFVSAFKNDEDFRNACEEFAPDLLNEINSIRLAFGSYKYVWQSKLSQELLRLCVIGGTEKKLNFGIKNDQIADFFGVTDLRDFFIKKKQSYLPFNFWYERQMGDDENSHRKVLHDALSFLQKEFIMQLPLDLID